MRILIDGDVIAHKVAARVGDRVEIAAIIRDARDEMHHELGRIAGDFSEALRNLESF